MRQQVTLKGTFTPSFQRLKPLQLRGKDQKSCLQRNMAHFPTYLKRFSFRTTDSCSCGELGSPLQFATSFPPYKVILSYQDLKRPRVSPVEKSPQQLIVKN
ncbi:hypothetical protein AVEN_83049-1 [Araneus ventricosus]|uniref:Uncharacterized protein n=1 Tax=Araneus ventricosus TaxID=182803 RepID=A0A4Y2AM97_ARAVE|nr:hypothetical protein AVEN_83049-1 [Araneus ventricosus]